MELSGLPRLLGRTPSASAIIKIQARLRDLASGCSGTNFIRAFCALTLERSQLVLALFRW